MSRNGINQARQTPTGSRIAHPEEIVNIQTANLTGALDVGTANERPSTVDGG